MLFQANGKLSIPIILIAACAGCSSDDTTDATTADSGVVDTGTVDTGSPSDTGQVADAGTIDSGADSTVDTGVVDSGTVDTGVVVDSGSTDGPVVASCVDGVRNGNETGIDCGGDCPIQFCCFNGHLDTALGETGVDCGGACQNCSRLCEDGLQNQNETGVDCGGACGTDCCNNGYFDQGETGVDCGGSCGTCSTRTFFVSNQGDNNDTGTSPGEAWQTIGKINGEDLQAGDQILFERGGVWRDQLVIDRSGAQGNHITFGAYGTGPKPRILGSAAATGWTQINTNVWQSATIGAPYDEANRPYGKWSSIFFGNHDGSTSWGRVQSAWTGIQRDDVQPSCGNNYSLLQEEYDWCWENDHLYVYIPSNGPSNPNDRYTFVEVPQRASSIAMPSHNPQSYITIDGLEMMYGTRKGYDDGWPMAYEASGLTIQNCHIGYIGIPDAADGMGMAIWHSDMVVRNNVIHDTGRRNISYNIYNDNGRTGIDNLVFENVVIENNVLYHGYHTTGLDISSDNGTSGAHGDILRNFTIRNNLIWDDPSDDPQDSPNDYTSMGIYLVGEAAQFDNFKIYNNILKHIKQKVLILHNVENTSVFNNTFYSMNARAGVVGTGSEWRGVINVSSTPVNLRIESNVFYGDVDTSQYRLRHIVFSSSDARNGVTALNRNVYFHEYGAQDILHDGSNGINMSEWQQYQQSGLGWDADSPIPADPELTDVEAGDFRPSVSTSPVVNNGQAFTERTTDFLGNPFHGDPDIGAIEYQP